jgi:hypothetical protein
MKLKYFASVIVAACLVTSCDKSPSTQSSSPPSQSSARNDLVGSWRDTSGIVIQLLDNGRVTTSYGADGVWSQRGNDQLSLSLAKNGIASPPQTFNIQWTDEDNILLTAQGENAMRLTRVR